MLRLRHHKLFLLSLFQIFYTQIYTQLKIPAVFSDNMILQRDKPLPVWGKAKPGSLVAVSFLTQQKTCNTDSDGNWSVVLDPLHTSIVPANLVIKNDTTITFHNILVGDIWICSGQSNMEYTLDRRLKKYAPPKSGTDPSEAEVSITRKPSVIRYLYVERTLNKIPELPTKGWTDGNDTIVRYISAIGYFFAKEIFKKANVPIGIISSSWGGTRVEEWTPPSAYSLSTVFSDIVKTDTFKIDGIRPGLKYKGMIDPLIPFAVKGVLWYQGESNCMIEDYDTYPEKFRLFVNTWRSLFKDDQLPIYTVQISPYLYSTRNDSKKHSADLLPKFWEAQTKCLSVPNTSMVVTTDLVDNLKDIHPSYKWVIAHRLALQAMAKTYLNNSGEYSGPVFQSAKRKKNKLILSFSHYGKGLVSNDGQPLNWFSIAGKKGKFVNATAVIESNQVILYSDKVKRPKYVRFAWNEKAQPNLFNKDGLPAFPFRNDSF